MAGLTVIALPPQVNALLRIAATADGGATTVIACDQNVACVPGPGVTVLSDTNPAVGNLSVAPFTINGVTLLGTVSNIADPPGLGVPNNLSSSAIEITNNSAAPVTIQVAISSTNFVPPSTQAFTSGSGTWSTGSTGSTIAMQWWNDPANGQGAESFNDTPGNMVDSFMATAPAASPFSFSHNGGPFTVSDPSPFSMTLSYQLTLVAGGDLISRGFAEVKPIATTVPEPSSLLLLLGSACGLIALRARKMRV